MPTDTPPPVRQYWEDLPVGRVLALGSVTVEREEVLAFARQYDPQADYVSLWLPELRSVPQHLRHTPFLLSGLQLDALRYPRLEQVPESWKPYLPVAA